MLPANFFILALCRGPPAVCRSLSYGFFWTARQAKCARVLQKSPPGPIDSRRHCATLFASLHHIRADNESLCHLPIARIANYSEKEVQHSFWA